jgi:hypothetical protein
MSEHDLKRVEVLSEVSQADAHERRLYRLMARYRADGGFGVGPQGPRANLEP